MQGIFFEQNAGHSNPVFFRQVLLPPKNLFFHFIYHINKIINIQSTHLV
jgi:hypothetical protein